MDFLGPIISSVGSLFENQFPIAFQLIGVCVVFISAIDSVVPDALDGGFFKKLREIPILGRILDFFVGMSTRRINK